MTAEQATTARTDNVSAVRATYAAFAAGDLPVVLGMLHADVEWTEAAGSVYGGTYRGHDAVVQGVIARLGEEWSPFHVEPEEYFAAADAVAVLGTYRGTYGATGRSMAARFVHVWHFRDGRVARFEQVADTVSLNSPVG
jgi:ketosteroid isomerase-like protein